MAKAINRISDLIIKHLKEEITVEEYQELQDWVHLSEENSTLFAQLTDADSLAELLQESDSLRQRIKQKIDERIGDYGEAEYYEQDDPRYYDRRWAERLHVGTEEGKLVYLPGVRHSRKKVWLYAAAACFLALLTGGYFWMTSVTRSTALEHSTLISKNDLLPGRQTAILTLSDGSTILLDSARNGSIIRQGMTEISKQTDGKLAYKTTGPVSAIGFNTISTPRGGEYQIILPDGSKAWLNAASSLRFPTAFSSNTREVELTGEAYFDVTHDKRQPFQVKVCGMTVTVLGTSFDIKAYPDENEIKTTLITGSLRVSKDDQKITLLPGQQSSLTGNQLEINKTVNTEEVVAWKNGLFEFNSSDIETVMRAFSRWYDVDILYETQKDSHRFTGQISRGINASEVLQILTASGYHFKVNGKKIIVLP